MAETIQQLLRERAGDDSTAILTDAGARTWREHVADASVEAAAVIDLLDRDRPPHVGVLLGNTPQMLTSMAAAGLGGYVLCGINTTRRGEGLAADVRRAQCQLLLTDADHRGLLEGLDLEGVRVVDTSTHEWDGPSELTPLREVEAMDTFMMIFTSGTSGDPKAVQVAHLMVLFSGLNLVGRFEITSDDVCYLSMPLFHSNAVVAGWAVALAGGAAMVPARFSASRFLDDVRRHGVTYMNYVGRPLAYVLATPEQPDDADNTLRVAFGNEAGDRDIDDFSRRFGCQVMDGFGSTELAVIITREPGTPRGSIGKGFDGVAVYDAESVTECAVAEFDETGALANPDAAIGELVNTQGAGYFQGYYNDEAANADRMRHGMYWSGDLAYRDVDGWIYLAGRTADWMRVDGENIAAAPVERILARIPAVSQVAVYAVRDEQVGDQVMAALVLADGETLGPAELEQFLHAQADLSPKAWPRYVRLAAALPATATNKILKRELVAQGATAAHGEQLWEREERGTGFRDASLVPREAPQPPMVS